jgi:ribonuclease P protein component
VHLLAGAGSVDGPVAGSVAGPIVGTAPPPRAGLVVSKAVGGSVVRHRLARRLRHQLRPVVTALPAGTRLVVRAAPRAADAGSAALGADLRAALDRLVRPGA